MNKLLISVAACAMLAPVAACADETPQTETVKTEASADATMKTAAVNPDKDKMKAETKAKAKTKTAGELSISPGSVSAKELLGEEIDGSNDEDIAKIDDIVINENGQAQEVVFVSGGLFGLGGKKGAVDYKAVDIAVDREGDAEVSLSMTDDAIKQVAEFKNDELNDYSLASELLGAQATLQPTDDITHDIVVNDIILDGQGSVEYLLVQKTTVGPIGAGDRYAVPFKKLKVEQGDGGLVLAMTEAQLDASPTFAMFGDFEDDAEKAWDKTKANAHDAADDMEDAADDAGDDIEDAVD